MFIPLLFSLSSVINAQLGLRTPIIASDPISAKISYEKDNVTVGDLFKVYYDKKTKNGENKEVIVGYIKTNKVVCTSCGGINLKYFPTDSNSVTTFFKVGASRIENGMTIKKMTRHWISYSLEYGLSKNSLYSGPSISISLMLPFSRITVFTNQFDHFSSTKPINYSGYSRITEANGLNMGLKYEKPLALNYFEISPFFGASGAVLNFPSFKNTKGIEIIPPTTAMYRGLTGVRAAINIGPYLQVFSNLNYDFKISNDIEDDRYDPTVKDQLNNSLIPKSLSYTFGLRIR